MKNAFQNCFPVLFKKIIFLKQILIYSQFNATKKNKDPYLPQKHCHKHLIPKYKYIVFCNICRKRIFLPVLTTIDPKTHDLSGLKDIIMPIKPPFFPLQWGWWILGFAFLSFLIILWRFFRHFHPTPQTYAIHLLKELKKKNLSPILTSRELSKLLKRVALVCFSRETVAQLSYKEWSNFLTKQGNQILSKEQADFIAISPYLPLQKHVAPDIKKIYTSVEKWIRFVFKRTHSWKSNNRTF